MDDDEMIQAQRIEPNKTDGYIPVIEPLDGWWDKYHVYFTIGFGMRYGGNNGYGWHHHTLKGAQKRVAKEAAKLEARAEHKAYAEWMLRHG